MAVDGWARGNKLTVENPTHQCLSLNLLDQKGEFFYCILGIRYQVGQNKFLKRIIFLFFLMTSSPPLRYFLSQIPFILLEWVVRNQQHQLILKYISYCVRNMKKMYFLVSLSYIAVCCHTIQFCSMNIFSSAYKHSENFKNV